MVALPSEQTLERDPFRVRQTASQSINWTTGKYHLDEYIPSIGRPGVVLYDGESCVRFGPKFAAVPIRLLWDHGN